MNNILLTGYSGFIGNHLLQVLNDSNYRVLCLGRSLIENSLFHQAIIDDSSDYSAALNNVDVIIHLAAQAQVLKEDSGNHYDFYRKTNTQGTINLAKQAVKAGVKRFIFISSIKVNGESTNIDEPFTFSAPRLPQDFYGQSKSEAELQLLELASETGMEVVIIRPPLVYGPNVKANFASLMNLVSKGILLPFGCIKKNKRSLVSVKNLVDLIITCIDHPKAVNEVFLVSDDHDLSTASMVKQMSEAFGGAGRMLPVPLWCFHLAGKVLGKQTVIERLLGSLQVDIIYTKTVLNWTPPQSVEDAFKETVYAFLESKRNKV